MNSLPLKNKLFLISIVFFLVLSITSSFILFHAQKKQAISEIDELITSETITLSALANAQPEDKFDFEISNLFIAQYKTLKPNSFFRFVDVKDNHIYYESIGAPKVGCELHNEKKSRITNNGNSDYRFQTKVYRPQIDSDWTGSRDFVPGELCLIVGINEGPFRSAIFNTLVSTIPLMIFLFALLTVVLIILVQRMTKDLTLLAESIETSNFSATHEFPPLPEVKTLEVKVLAAKLKDLHEQAAQVYREMWLFFGRASHQIKTPVAAMQATLDVLLRKDRTKEELLAGLEDIHFAAQSLTSLTKKLVASSRVSYQTSPLKMEVNIFHFFNRYTSIFDALAKSRGVNLKIEGDVHINIKTDIGLLSEIFDNIIENAILYSPFEKNSTVKISWSVHENKNLLQVSDSGNGIPDFVLSAIGSPFVRGDERFNKGSGLGLSIVKRAAKILEAELIFNSSTEGTTVFLYLNK